MILFYKGFLFFKKCITNNNNIMDFKEQTQIAIDKVVEEQLPTMLQKRATEMIEGILDSIFRYGEVRDSIKKKIEASINVNLENFDLIDYSALIGKTINDNLLQQINLQPIIDMTQDIVGFVNQKEITLQEIADMFKEVSMSDSEAYEGEITFIEEHSEKYNWIEVFADVEPDKDRYDCAIKFIFSTEQHRREIFSFKTKEKYYDKDFREISPARVAMYRSIEAKIFRLYSAQVKIKDFDREICTYWDRNY